MTSLEKRAFLTTWDHLVLAVQLNNKIMYEDWMACWEFYHLASPKLVAWGH